MFNMIEDMASEQRDHVDVLIVGAGISGIGAAAHLEKRLPGTSYAVLERREAIGGTWDLFRYPGVRSDSDMHTLGFALRPWHRDKVLADGPSIKSYVESTAEQFDIVDKIRFGHRVLGADWDSATSRWTVHFEGPEGPGRITAGFLWGCSGYYDYDEPHQAELPGIEAFAGQVVHPQHWPEDLDYAGKKVVVIGSGATAVTLVPAMAGEAGHVTMLQRSPSYIMSIPEDDPLAGLLRRVLPEGLAAGATRWRNVLLQAGLFQLSRRRPHVVRRMIRAGAVRQLPEGYDVDAHFGPSYDPWDQRMCMVPNGDLFRAIRHGRADVVTGRIDTFTEHGIRMQDGTEVEADIVVTATGLKLQLLGGMDLTVDGVKVDPHEHLVYKGAMLSDVPNLAFVIGYTNASWTLKADLVSEYVVRLLKTMRRKNASVVVPVKPEGMGVAPLMNLDSGYINRALDELPQAGDEGPWRMPSNYLLDLLPMRYGRIDDGQLAFR